MFQPNTINFTITLQIYFRNVTQYILCKVKPILDPKHPNLNITFISRHNFAQHVYCAKSWSYIFPYHVFDRFYTFRWMGSPKKEENLFKFNKKGVNPLENPLLLYYFNLIFFRIRLIFGYFSLFFLFLG